MRVYDLSTIKTSAIIEITEKQLQKIVEGNINDLLGVHLICGEFKLDGHNRIDTLAIDSKGNIVVIEYKQSKGMPAITQGLRYMEVIRIDPRHTIERIHMNYPNFKYQGIRVICIARSFSLDGAQLENLKESGVELLEYTYCQPHLLFLTPLLENYYEEQELYTPSEFSFKETLWYKDFLNFLGIQDMQGSHDTTTIIENFNEYLSRLRINSYFYDLNTFEKFIDRDRADMESLGLWIIKDIKTISGVSNHIISRIKATKKDNMNYLLRRASFFDSDSFTQIHERLSREIRGRIECAEHMDWYHEQRTFRGYSKSDSVRYSILYKIWGYTAQEEAKSCGWRMYDTFASLDDKILGIELIHLAWYCRSFLAAKKPALHPNFPQYMKYTLSVDIGEWEPECAKILLMKYGQEPNRHLRKGDTYYTC